MDLRIRGLPREPFDPLFELEQDDLRRRGAVRRITAAGSIYPCRVSLQDAAEGEEVVLTNFAHLPDQTTPYRAIGPIFVRRAARETWDRINEVPEMMKNRHFAVRAYDADFMLQDAQIAKGSELLALASRMFGVPGASHVHAHFAAHGCYICAIERV